MDFVQSASNRRVLSRASWSDLSFPERSHRLLWVKQCRGWGKRDGTGPRSHVYTYVCTSVPPQRGSSFCQEVIRHLTFRYISRLLRYHLLKSLLWPCHLGMLTPVSHSVAPYLFSFLALIMVYKILYLFTFFIICLSHEGRTCLVHYYTHRPGQCLAYTLRKANWKRHIVLQ